MGAASRVEALLGPLLIVLLSSSSQEGLRELVASPSPKYHKVLTFISTTKSEGATVLTGGSLLEIVAIAVAFAHLVHCSALCLAVVSPQRVSSKEVAVCRQQHRRCSPSCPSSSSSSTFTSLQVVIIMVREQTAVSFYNKLRESASKSPSTPLLIFPSTSDVDSLCTLKIIFHILESDGLQYACYPVSSFNEIHNYAGPTLASAAETGDYVAMLLINWGCHRDLQKTLNLPPSARVFVVDSHRRIHLNNISQENESVVVLFTNEDEKIADLVYSFDITLAELANASYMCREGNEVEESEEDSDELDEEDSENSDNDEDEQGSRRKRRRVSDSDPVQLFKNQVKKYYKLGTFHGKPSGCLMYELADSLRKNTNEVLWLSCVSLTDQFVHERLSGESYRDGVAELED